MKRFLLLPVILSTLAIISACSSEPAEPNERPGGTGTPPVSPEPDYSSIVANTHIRFESDTLSIDFEAGGILYTVAGTSHRFIELASSTNIMFDPDEPSLRINGRNTHISECRLIERNIDMCWYMILPDTAIVAVESVNKH